MPVNEQHQLRGRLTITLSNAHGDVVKQHTVNNLITTAGKKLVAEMFSGVIKETPEIKIAIGSGGGDGDGKSLANAADIQLKKHVDSADANISAPKVEGDIEKSAVATVSAIFESLSPGMEQSISEAGIVFNFVGNPAVLYNRVTFPEVTRNANLQMTMTWEVAF
ncbi:hypothetical protein ACFL2V_00035 [Pseudomonadota bacterium]